MTESKAKELGLTPLGFIKSYAFPALDPRENMLLGNVYAIPEALKRAKLSLSDIDLLEIHEAFAAQALSNIKLFTDQACFDDKLPDYEVLGDLIHPKSIYLGRIIGLWASFCSHWMSIGDPSFAWFKKCRWSIRDWRRQHVPQVVWVPP